MLSEPFSGWAGSRQPRLVIVGEAWGETEYQTGTPFSGMAGAELARILLDALPKIDLTVDLKYALKRSGWHQMRNAWATKMGIGFTNVVNQRPPNNDFETFLCAKKELPSDYPSIPPLGRGSAAYLRPEFLCELNRLGRELHESSPFCTVPVGATATWALLGRSDISSIRGIAILGPRTGLGTAAGLKLLPTYHPSAIIRGRHDWRAICVIDFMKAWRESSFRELRRPERIVVINPTLPEIHTWTRAALADDPSPLSVDCETAGPLITCISFAHSDKNAITIPFRSKNGTRNYWNSVEDELSAWHHVRTLLECGRPLVFQNGMYDMQFLIRMGFDLRYATDDSMLLHHSLYPEVQKSLGFLGSIYTDESSWKDLRKKRALKGEKLDE